MEKLSVRAIIEHEGKFLLVRHTFDDSFWALPGGRMEDGEEIETALERELIEETGITPSIGSLLFVHQMKDADTNEVTNREFFFHVTNGDEYTNIDLKQTTHGETEIAEVTFKDPSRVKLLPSFLVEELPRLLSEKFSTPTRSKISIKEN